MPIISKEKAIEVLKKGGIVAIPTETVYGLAGKAQSAIAVQKIYKAKNRPVDNPLICHADSVEMIERYAKLTEIERALFLTLSPGPISIRVEVKENTPLTPALAGQTHAIFRIPLHNIAREIISGVGEPLAVPSANTSGRLSPTTAKMVEADLGEKIDGIVDGGPCTVGLESTIIEIKNNETIEILRPGAIGAEDIGLALSSAGKKIKNILYSESAQKTPGAAYAHYAPNTPVKKISSAKSAASYDCIIATDEWIQANNPQTPHISIGSEKNMMQIGAKLYHTLFDIDQKKYQNILFAEIPFGETGIEKAIAEKIAKMIK